jgi:hypothetical protein
MIALLNRSFSSHAGPDSKLDLPGLASALALRNSYLAERMLAAFDRDGDGVVNRAEFLLGVRRLVFGTTRDKLRFAFHIHDLNGDSMLDKSEVQQMIRLSLLEEQSEGTPVDAARLTNAVQGRGSRRRRSALVRRLRGARGRAPGADADESLDEHRCVDVNIYMTEGRGNITAVALNLAREVSHALGNPDYVTGLRSQTHMGSPDWRSELERIAALYAPEAVDVYFCGPPGLARKIRSECEQLRMRFRQEHF